MQKRVTFNNKLLPYLLVAPQIAITIIFFIWPAAQALQQSVLQEDAFGISSEFIGLENFQRVLSDESYLNALQVTFVFSLSATFLGLALALLFAVMADRIIRGASVYKTLLIWPYAVAPAVAGVLWALLFNPSLGILVDGLAIFGLEWNILLNGTHALILVILAAVWSQLSYNFVFFLAGLQAIPKSLIEAGAIDGAGPWRRFWTIIFPLLAPTSFFLLVVNIVNMFFNSFGIIDAVTDGGPGQSTETLVFKVYEDGVRALDLGGSSAQSVILMVIVVALTIFQFRFIERKVHY